MNYINAQGGWTYVGWTWTGIVHDNSDIGPPKESENRASQDVKPHISYLYPTSPENIASKEFQGYCISLEKLTTDNANDNNADADPQGEQEIEAQNNDGEEDND